MIWKNGQNQSHGRSQRLNRGQFFGNDLKNNNLKFCNWSLIHIILIINFFKLKYKIFTNDGGSIISGGSSWDVILFFQVGQVDPTKKNINPRMERNRIFDFGLLLFRQRNVRLQKRQRLIGIRLCEAVEKVIPGFTEKPRTPWKRIW